MIRWLLALLIAANLAWAAWSQGWLRPLGIVPGTQTEPERLARQLHPDALRIQPLPPGASLAASAAPPQSDASAPLGSASPAPATPASAAAVAAAVASVMAAASAPPPAVQSSGVCLQAGIFDDRQIGAVRSAVARLPAESWRIEPVALPSRWMVYIGKLTDADALRAKRAELQKLGVSTDNPGAALQPGLSLGRFSSQDAADRALADLSRKGVHTARVVQERRDGQAWMLRLPQADAALRQQARALNGALAGKELHPCE